jgi:2-aminoethylphosphonate-pyruvate transaminase
MKQDILLNPGPVNLSTAVRVALMGPDICHREPEYAELIGAIRQKILQVYDLDPSRYTAILLAGSGTAANEAVVASFLSEKDKLLVLSNGVYGERIDKMAEIYRIPHTTLRYDWGEEIELKDVRRALEDKTITMVAMIHHETTTGLLNDLAGVGALVKARKDVRLFVDGVSSFGGEEIEFDSWGVDIITAVANKCIHGVPGVAFVLVNKDMLDVKYQARSVYLDLWAYYADQCKGKATFTSPIQVLYAFRKALEEYLHEGRNARMERYRKLAQKIRELAQEAGLRTLLPLEKYSHTLTSFYLPKGLSYEALHDHLKKHGFVIYAGQGGLTKNIFRIANMGEIHGEDMVRLFDKIREIL